MHTAILGAGAVGLTLAARLTAQGEQVTVIEREAGPGGLAAGFPIGDVTLEKFYHHLFRSDTAIIKLIHDIGLGDRLIWGMPNTSSLVGGQTWRLDSASSVLQFAPLPVIDRVRMGAAIAALKFWPNYHTFEKTTADAWLRQWMGKRAYETAWQPLMVGKFGSYAPDVSLAWFWARIHCRTPQLGYLRGGFQIFYDRLAQITEAMGGHLRFATAVTGISEAKQGQIDVNTSAGSLVVDRVVSTLPTRLTMKLLPTLPTYQRRYDWGDAIGAHCLILALDRPFMESIYWLNINDPDYPFLALVEHTNFIPPAEYGGRHLVYLGNYLPMTHPVYRTSKEEVITTYSAAMKRINPDFSPGWIKESWMFAAPFAQPVVTREFPSHIPPHETPIPNVYLANMFQVYPQDRGQNYAVAMAQRLANQLLQSR